MLPSERKKKIRRKIKPESIELFQAWLTWPTDYRVDLATNLTQYFVFQFVEQFRL